MKGKRGRRGFTLIEMLVVVLIVAILSAVALARYMNIRDKSMVAAATYDLDLVRKLLAVYATDYSHYPTTVSSYQDLKDQLVDPNGQPYGRLPVAYTFQWLSYEIDADSNYLVRIMVADNGNTVLRATPDAVQKE